MITKEEKLQIIESQEKTLIYSKYGFELNVLRENAKSSPNKENLDSLKAQIADIDAQIAVLNAEKTKVEAEKE